MSTKNDGGPAFPAIEIQEYGSMASEEIHTGMSLRQYYAGKALQGVIVAIMSQENHRWSSGDFASEAVEIADAMLAELDKP